MYHRIPDAAPPPASHPYFEIDTGLKRFEEQMECLEANGYTVVPLGEMETALVEAEGKNVVLTFDDGFRDFETNAFPVLERMRFPATVFLPTNLVGTEQNGEAYLDWEQVARLSRAGVDFGSHSLNHGRLHRMKDQEIVREIADSRREIEFRLGKPVDSFSFPYAFPQEDSGFRERLREILSRNGIRRCLTTVIGQYRSGDDPMFIQRIPVNEYDDEPLFLAKLEGDYNWLRVFQRASRSIRKSAP
jgi:peptidoglycan/xylan/chitin deacetylase (PgdA/CDA1 family)